MNEQIAEIIRTLLVDLDWVDSASGVVRSLRRQGEGIVKVFPVATNVTPDYDPEKITEMTPNSAYNSVLYFEDQGFSSRREGRWMRCESRLRLVCWINGAKMRFNSTQAIKAIQEILSGLPMNYSSGDFGQIRFEITEETKTAAIFSAYSYNEEQSQYLTYPNDYFSLMITTRFLSSLECYTDTNPVFLDQCGDDINFDYCEHFLDSLGQRQLDCIKNIGFTVYDNNLLFVGTVVGDDLQVIAKDTNLNIINATYTLVGNVLTLSGIPTGLADYLLVQDGGYLLQQNNSRLILT